IPYALVLLHLVESATTVAGAAATPSIDWAECKKELERQRGMKRRAISQKSFSAYKRPPFPPPSHSTPSLRSGLASLRRARPSRPMEWSAWRPQSPPPKIDPLVSPVPSTPGSPGAPPLFQIPYALVLLILVAPVTTAVGAAAPSIDWAECNAQEVVGSSKVTHCILLSTCVSTDTGVYIEVYPLGRSTVKPCHIGVSIRPFSVNVWLVKLQVLPKIAGSTAPILDPAKGIQFFDGERVLFGCILSNATMKATGDSLLNTELFGADSYLTPTGGYCTFLIKEASSLPGLNAVFKISYALAGQAIDLKTINDDPIFFNVNKRISCDPFSLTADYSTTVNGFYKAPIPDVLKEPASCDGIPFAKLFVGAEQAMNFECKRAEKNYYFKRGTEAPETALRENEEVFCAISITSHPLVLQCRSLSVSTTCKDLIGSSRNTPKYGLDPTTGQTSLKCDNPSHKMLINDEFYFDGAPECLSSRDSPNVGAWFARNESFLHEQIHNALCTDQISCDMISSFNSTVPEGEFYENAYLEYGNLSCADDAFLRCSEAHADHLRFHEGNLSNEQTGPSSGSRSKLPPDEASSDAAVAGASAGTIVGIASGAALLVLIGAIGGIFWFFLIRRRKKKKTRKARYAKNHSSLGLPSSSSGPGNGRKRKRKLKIPSADTPYIELPAWVRRNLFYTGVKKMKNKKMKKVVMSSILALLDLAFELDIDPTNPSCRSSSLWSAISSTSVRQRTTLLPNARRLFPRLRLFLLDRADKWLEKWKDTRDEKAEVEKIRRNDKGEIAVKKVKIKKAELGGVGFIRGVLLIMKYKLNIMNKEEKAKIVDRVTTIFLKKGNGMDQETGSKRCPGVHERFGYATEQRIMFEYLWDEFNNLLKKPLEPRPVYGSKMQHVLFAIGCALEKEPMAAVWKVMKEDKRFIAQDFMWVMYGRDWLWDGAWVSMFQNPGFMRHYDPKIEEYMLKQHYKWHNKWEKNRHKHGMDVNRYLLENDKREIEGYTPVNGDELVAQAKEKWEKRSDRKIIERLLQGGNSPTAVEDEAGRGVWHWRLLAILHGWRQEEIAPPPL
ncbi:hypothetical protein PRIPAC_73213, partial [Pristionchus pacificus]|uniref:Uncharacterized protein n=1 Tax=Pristionchus pacificus TaxID=54126 RepID=A0A2A6C0A3_PRIPA